MMPLYTARKEAFTAQIFVQKRMMIANWSFRKVDTIVTKFDGGATVSAPTA